MSHDSKVLNTPKSKTTQYIWNSLGSYSELAAIKTGNFKSSPIFCDCDDVEWSLLLYPNGLNNDDKGYLSLYVQCRSNNVVVSAPLKITCECSIRHTIASNIYAYFDYTSEGQMCFPRDDRNTQCWGFPKFVRTAALVKYSTEIQIIKCVIELSEFFLKEKECRLLNDFERMLEMPDFNDVHFRVKGQILHAHRGILAARSPVFAAMFKYDMAKNIEGPVIIEDIDFTVFKEMLRFMYTGKVQKLEDMAIALAVAADKYDLDRLKIMCEIHLSANLTKDNVTDVLEYADQYCAVVLKTNAMEFINAHATTVIGTEGYKSFRKSDRIRSCYEELAIKKMKRI